MFARPRPYADTQSFANANIYFDAFAHFKDYSYLNTTGDVHAHHNR